MAEIGARYCHDSPPFGRNSDPDPASRRRPPRSRHFGGQPRRPPAAVKACATACTCRSTRVDRVDVLAGSAPISRESRPRAGNEAAFYTEHLAGDAGQLGNRPTAFRSQWRHRELAQAHPRLGACVRATRGGPADRLPTNSRSKLTHYEISPRRDFHPTRSQQAAGIARTLRREVAPAVLVGARGATRQVLRVAPSAQRSTGVLKLKFLTCWTVSVPGPTQVPSPLVPPTISQETLTVWSPGERFET